MATMASYKETDIDGNVVTQYNYSPFGQTEVIGTDIPQPFRFTGREYDPETDLYFYRARYYSPDMRRFISEDPIRFAAGDVNFYAYVGSNPVNFIDPLGLWKKDVHYDLTYQLARSECGDDLAKQIAAADNAVDTNLATRPTSLARYRTYHYRSLSDGLKTVGQAKDASSFGAALHTVQDYYSHVATEKEPGEFYHGHIGNDWVDKPFKNMGNYFLMIAKTKKLIEDFCNKICEK